MAVRTFAGLAALGLWLAACSDPSVPVDAGRSDAGSEDPSRPPETIGPEQRPARLYAPPAHDGDTALPLVVLLHGYTVDSMLQDLYFGLTRHARRDGFYALLPDGTIDAEGEPHWDVVSGTVDDHAYLRALIEEAMEVAVVDPSAVFAVGHSNGGFMAYRMACDSADLVTGIASLAGSDALETCAPAAEVAVLQIHGTADGTIPYEGGSIAGLTFPSATATVERWAERAGCDTSATESGAPLDLVADIDGPETTVTRYATNCRAAVELWTMEGADHIPALSDEFTPRVIGWLRAHPR